MLLDTTPWIDARASDILEGWLAYLKTRPHDPARFIMFYKMKLLSHGIPFTKIEIDNLAKYINTLDQGKPDVAKLKGWMDDGYREVAGNTI
jgi:hypothetical protein